MLSQLIRAVPVIGIVPLTCLVVCGIASAQVGEDHDTDPPTDQRDQELDNGNPSFNFELPEVQRNITRGTGPRIERVIVRGQMPLSGYRRRIDTAVEDTWEAFNDANSDDQFDVHCRYEASTGTRMLQHVCRPQFLDDATSRAAGAFMQLDKASSFGLQQIEAARAHYLQRQLGDELRGLATADSELRVQLEKMDEQLQNYEDARRRED